MQTIPEYIGGLPCVSGYEPVVSEARLAKAPAQVRIPLAGVKSACAVALHMHQPLVPLGGNELTSAGLISNLQHMLDNPESGDNHNATVFHRCYKRMAGFVRELVA